MRRVDITGLTTEGHTVVSRAGVTEDGHSSTWNCRCNFCGQMYVVRLQHAKLDSGCKACGVARAGIAHRKHGLGAPCGQHPLYKTWTSVKVRCTKPNSISWHNYGGRGIQMHAAWARDFAAFVEYVTGLPHYGEEGRSLDRINNDGNYEPGNLRWATPQEQALNTRKNRRIEYDGRQWPVGDLARHLGVKYVTLLQRANKGQQLDAPVRTRGALYEYEGALKTLPEWAATLGLSYWTLRGRASRRGTICKGARNG